MQAQHTGKGCWGSKEVEGGHGNASVGRRCLRHSVLRGRPEDKRDLPPKSWVRLVSVCADRCSTHKHEKQGQVPTPQPPYLHAAVPLEPGLPLHSSLPPTHTTTHNNKTTDLCPGGAWAQLSRRLRRVLQAEHCKHPPQAEYIS